MPFYSKALQHGDVIKLVGTARKMEDNFDLSRFKAKILASHKKPVIALNMGHVGRLSRILNGFLTPVSHPVLPFRAAPGQLSAAEIRRGLSTLGMLHPKRFFLFGKPISASRSPALHNRLFQLCGLPHHYGLLETTRAEDIQETIRSLDFGGASVTIPLKRDVMGLLDEVTEAARLIGAINTIIPGRNHGCEGSHLIGDNTDSRGMIYCLLSAGAAPKCGGAAASGMVVGSGGTARAAIYALHQLGYSPIHISARDQGKSSALAASFPLLFNVRSCSIGLRPSVIISTVPANTPMDVSTKDAVTAALQHDDVSSNQGKILLEMAYTPSHTPLMVEAEKQGWKTIPGLEALAAQGWYQVRRTPHRPAADVT